MKWQRYSGQILIIFFALALVFAGATAARDGRQEPTAPLGSGFTYQGRLEVGGDALTGDCDFQFSLWNDASAGSQLGSTQSLNGVAVEQGLFTVTLNGGGQFGSSAFDGQVRWLEIAVQCGDDAGFTTLGRQALTAVPYAAHALTVPWNRLSDVPADLQDGDDDTTYSAGPGLSLNGTQFSVNGGAMQLPITGNCSAGRYVRAINADGSVVCGPDAPLNRPLAPFTNTLTTLDSAGSVGMYPSLTVGVDGLALISYWDVGNGDLKVAHCDDPACTGATTYTLDSTGDVGEETSLTIGADGLGLISYYDATNGNLKVAHCDNVVCSSATVNTVDSAGDVGQDSSLTIGADGLGLISYLLEDGVVHDLKVAHCDDVICSSATTSTLESGGSLGLHSSVAVGADGLGLISYLDAGGVRDLKVAHCNDLACSSATIATLDSADWVGYYGSLTIGADGLGLISYHDVTNHNLEVAHCIDLACSSATVNTLDSAGDVGTYTSVTMGADGLGLISYWDATNALLKVAHCIDAACTGAGTYSVDINSTLFRDTSVAVGIDGLPLIAYFDNTNADLVVVRCGSAFCVPNFRRR